MLSLGAPDVLCPYGTIYSPCFLVLVEVLVIDLGCSSYSRIDYEDDDEDGDGLGGQLQCCR